MEIGRKRLDRVVFDLNIMYNKRSININYEDTQ